MINKKQYIVLCLVLISSIFGTKSVQAAAHSLDTNIKFSDGSVYTITLENNSTVRRPYTSAGAFLSYSFNTWSSVVTATADDLALQVGSFIPPRDGTIMCADRGTEKGTCYLITEGKKAGFTSEQIFKNLGFTFKYALVGDVSFLTTTDNIDNESASHRTGTLINKNGTVYLVSPTGLKGVASMAELQSWGYWDGDVVSANSNDQSVNVINNLPLRQSGQLVPYDTMSIGGNPNSLKIIDPTSLPSGQVGQPYSYQFNASGGTAPYKWELSYNTDINYNVYQCCFIGLNASGLFSSGTTALPSPGNYNIAVKVTDAVGASAEHIFNYYISSVPVSNTPSFTIKTPKTGAVVTMGSNYSINWDLNNSTNPISTKIYLFDKASSGWVYAGAPFVTMLSQNGPNNYSWYVPFGMGPTSNSTPQYQIVITPDTTNCNPNYTICVDKDMAVFSDVFQITN